MDFMNKLLEYVKLKEEVDQAVYRTLDRYLEENIVPFDDVEYWYASDSWITFVGKYTGGYSHFSIPLSMFIKYEENNHEYKPIQQRATI